MPADALPVVNADAGLAAIAALRLPAEQRRDQSVRALASRRPRQVLAHQELSK